MRVGQTNRGEDHPGFLTPAQLADGLQVVMAREAKSAEICSHLLSLQPQRCIPRHQKKSEQYTVLEGSLVMAMKTIKKIRLGFLKVVKKWGRVFLENSSFRLGRHLRILFQAVLVSSVGKQGNACADQESLFGHNGTMNVQRAESESHFRKRYSTGFSSICKASTKCWAYRPTLKVWLFLLSPCVGCKSPAL